MNIARSLWIKNTLRTREQRKLTMSSFPLSEAVANAVKYLSVSQIGPKPEARYSLSSRVWILAAYTKMASAEKYTHPTGQALINALDARRAKAFHAPLTPTPCPAPFK